MNDLQLKRLKRLGSGTFILFAVGILYYVFIKITGLRIPCVSMILTNKFCPGCGMTRMFVAIIERDFPLAFRQNQAFFCLLPFFLLWGIYKAYMYVFNKKTNFMLWEKIILVVIAIALFIFAILRNIPGFEFLAPIPWEKLT